MVWKAIGGGEGDGSDMNGLLVEVSFAKILRGGG